MARLKNLFFSGKRIKRGLYRTDQGVLVQSDVLCSTIFYEKHSQMRLTAMG